MAYWAVAFVVVFILVAKLRKLKVFHLEWGLVRLEFEPESDKPRTPLQPRKPRKELRS